MNLLWLCNFEVGPGFTKVFIRQTKRELRSFHAEISVYATQLLEILRIILEKSKNLCIHTQCGIRKAKQKEVVSMFRYSTLEITEKPNWF